MATDLKSSGRRLIIACGGLRRELEALTDPNRTDIAFNFLDQNLHLQPETMTPIIQHAIDYADDGYEQIVLGYGLCSNGTVGLCSKRHQLVIPRVHDCITLFLGSRERYRSIFDKHPGNYYLTPGWIAEKIDPLSFLERDYVPRLGREDAEWCLRQEMKHYSHIVLIDAGRSDITDIRRRALENAEYLKKEYNELRSVDSYFEKIIFGPYDSPDFIVLKPGEVITQGPFLK